MTTLRRLTTSLFVLAGLLGGTSAWALHHEPPMAGVDEASVVGGENGSLSFYESHFNVEELENQF